MMDVRDKAWIWMAAAVCLSLAVTAASVAIFYTPGKGLSIALETSARVAFLFFWPAYVSGPLTSLFGNVFLPLRARARSLGLAFAAAILVHLGFVFWVSVIGAPPPVRTFIVFGAAAICTYTLALLSIDRVRRALPPSFWSPIRIVAMNYIAYAFIKDFTRVPIYDLAQAVKYLPFAAFAIGGVALNLAAWAMKLRHAPVKLSRPPVSRGGFDRPLGP